MSLALEQVRDRLEVFRKNAESTELVGLLLQISAELKMCEITPEALEKAAIAVPQQHAETENGRDRADSFRL